MVIMSRPSQWRYIITELAQGQFVIFLNTVKQSPGRVSTARGAAERLPESSASAAPEEALCAVVAPRLGSEIATLRRAVGSA